MKFRLFDYLDPAIVEDEASEARASKSPAVWPSEASAIRQDRSLFPIYGTCHRRVYYRMIGWPRQEDISAESPWKWVIGRAVEQKLTDLCVLGGIKKDDQHESLYIASGVKHYIKQLYLSIEMDVIVRDPETNRGWILECKSYDGYYKEQQIEKLGKPSEENLIQLCIYLFEMKDGKTLKETIIRSLQERQKLDALGKEHRNRCEANPYTLEQLSDEPLGAKLVYISRGECTRTEFDIEIFQDVDGFHYPKVNGIPYRLFTVESIYDRFITVQKYWFRARQEAYEMLLEQGIQPPPTMRLLLNAGDVPEDMTAPAEKTKAEYAAEKEYYRKLEETVRRLPESFFPPPEFEWSYSNERIQQLYAQKAIGKTKYKEWEDGKLSRLGDWQCAYCPYGLSGCIAHQRPDMAYQLYDISNLPEDVEVSIG